MSQSALVGLLLRTKIQSLREEVELLTDLLDRDQDPTTLGHLQELIGVRSFTRIQIPKVLTSTSAAHRTYSRK